MQGETGRQLLVEAGLEPDALQTLLVVDHGRSWQNTAAILRVLDALGWPWKLAWAGWLVPAPLRDVAYRWVARRRYRIFGRSNSCMLPPPGAAHRFLD
jgi:predicted DCC family thiol-disulfide oxidoreductase YuxK